MQAHTRISCMRPSTRSSGIAATLASRFRCRRRRCQCNILPIQAPYWEQLGSLTFPNGFVPNFVLTCNVSFLMFLVLTCLAVLVFLALTSWVREPSWPIWVM